MTPPGTTSLEMGSVHALEPDSPAPTLHRVRRPWVLVVVGILVAVAVGGAYVLGQSTAQPDRDAILGARDDIPVFGEVESRVVDSGITLAGVVRQGDSLALLTSVISAPAVVVRTAVSPGDELAFGQMVGVVSGKPYFVLPTPLPLYRELTRGDEGDDVLAFQIALAKAGLAVDPTGEVDYDTYLAVDRLFADASAELNWYQPLPTSQFLALPTATSTVISRAEVGETISADNPLVTVRAQPTHVTFRADVVTVTGLSEGTEVTISGTGGEFVGTIVSIGEFTKATENTPPGREVVVTSADPFLQEIAESTPVTVRMGAEDTPSLSVPLSAVRTDSKGDYVLVPRAGSKTVDLVRVAVTITGNDGGWAAIAENDKIKVGQRIQVSP